MSLTCCSRLSLWKAPRCASKTWHTYENTFAKAFCLHPFVLNTFSFPAARRDFRLESPEGKLSKEILYYRLAAFHFFFYKRGLSRSLSLPGAHEIDDGSFPNERSTAFSEQVTYTWWFAFPITLCLPEPDMGLQAFLNDVSVRPLHMLEVKVKVLGSNVSAELYLGKIALHW